MTTTLVTPVHPGDTPTSARIRQVSASMARVCLAIACAIPLLPLLVFGLALAGIVTRAEPVAQEPLALWAMVVLGVSKVVPLVLLMVGLWRAHACFKRFAKGQFFASSAVRALREFSAWTAASAVASLAGYVVLGVLMNSLHFQHLAWTIASSGHWLTLLFAGAVWVMAAMMDHTRSLAEENASFV